MLGAAKSDCALCHLSSTRRYDQSNVAGHKVRNVSGLLNRNANQYFGGLNTSSIQGGNGLHKRRAA
jgi:hypothetical protein